jgi:hypothetical protein
MINDQHHQDQIIGIVRSSLSDPHRAPRQPDEAAPPAELHIDASLSEALIAS